MAEHALPSGAMKSDPRHFTRAARIPGWLYKALMAVLAVAYGSVLSQIPTDDFQDFTNYLNAAENSWLHLLSYLEQGFLVTLANEPVWRIANAGLAVALPPETVVRVIIFGSATTVAWFVLTRSPRHFIWLVLFLLLPQVLVKHLVHLRQGAAIALFLWGWFSASRGVRWVLMGLTPFVHASFFFVLLILWAARAMTKMRLAMDIRTLAFGAIGLGIGLNLGWLAMVLGARQAETFQFSMPDVSGLGFFFWAIVLGVMFLEGRHFLREHAFETGFVIFYLSTYWFIEVTARIYESGILLVLLSGLVLTGLRRQAFLILILTYGVIDWGRRSMLPGLGFVIPG